MRFLGSKRQPVQTWPRFEQIWSSLAFKLVPEKQLVSYFEEMTKVWKLLNFLDC